MSSNNKDERLPVAKYVKERKSEIQQFLSAIMVRKSNSRAFQSLPRYLRRRTMSTKIYRVPLHLRFRARKEMEKCAGTDNKDKLINTKKGRVVRKAKRRPSYLLRDYERRQKTFKWLETHIWHAKRTHMINLWKYRIAHKLNVKSFRPTFRASSHFSTIYDASYNSCFEITGNQGAIIEMMKQMTPPDSLSIGANLYISGSREGNTLLYFPNRYPYHLITPIQFLWKQQQKQENSQLWVWVHASTIDIVQPILENETKRFNLKLTSLAGELQRFELTGPKSHSILQSILQPVDVNTGQPDSNSDSARVWHALKQLRTAATLPPGTVISLDVIDPRLICRVPPSVAHSVGSVPNPPQVPPTSIEQQQLHNIIINLSSLKIASSKLQDSQHRQEISSNIEPIAQIYQRRKNPLIKSQYSSPSIILIQKEGALTRGYGSGWDIIVPKSWGTAFWIPMIYGGAWAIALENRDTFLLEQGLPSFPSDFPDSPSYKEYHDIMNKEKIEKYNRTPKGKRPNYSNNCIYFPYSLNWQWILRYQGDDLVFNNNQDITKKQKIDTTDNNNNNNTPINIHDLKSLPFFVYRGKLAMSLLPIKKPVMKNNKYDTQTQNQANPRGLVRVSVKMYNGGKPVENSVIYTPTDFDLERLRNRFTQNHYGPIDLDVEGSPSDPEEFYQQTKRKPIGFVVKGEQSLVRGIGSGIGYCSAVSFVNLHNNAYEKSISPLGFAFIQNPTSRVLYPVILTLQP